MSTLFNNYRFSIVFFKFFFIVLFIDLIIFFHLLDQNDNTSIRC